MSFLGNLTGGAAVVVSSNFTPPMSIGVGGGSGDGSSPSQPSPLLSFLAPKVSIQENGAQLYAVAPAGEPTPPTTWLPAVGILVAVLAVPFVAGYLLGRK